MSGGGPPPPHHPHNRHGPPANSAWNHLPVPSGYFPRQPQLAHMQPDHSTLLHQATWHTPTTTEGVKLISHTQMLNDVLKNEALFPRDCVDLSLTRNVKKPLLSNYNGEHNTSASTAISLSVRDTNKINSLPPGMLDIQAVELTKCASPSLKSAISPGSIRATTSPGLKANSPGLLGSGSASKSLSPGHKSSSPGPTSTISSINLGNVAFSAVPTTTSASDLSKNLKRSNIRVDSILERLNPVPEKTFIQEIPLIFDKSHIEKPLSLGQSVIVQGSNNFDENSNSSSTTNAPTPREEDSASMHSNEDSLDSTKSRRKRKPSKTIRVNKDEDVKVEKEESLKAILQETNIKEAVETLPNAILNNLEENGEKVAEKSTDNVDGILPMKSKRKTSSEFETIDNIAAMVHEGFKEKTEEKNINAEEKLNEQSNGNKQVGKSDTEDTFDKVPDFTPFICDTETTGSTIEEKLQSNSIDTTIEKIINSQVNNLGEDMEKQLDSVGKVVSLIKSTEILEETDTSGKIPPVATPAQKKANITQFVEVENKLEEMFAGIVEDDSQEKSTTADTVKTESNFETTSKENLSTESVIKVETKLGEDDKSTTNKKSQWRRASSKSDQDGEIPAKKKRFTKTKSSTTPKKSLKPIGVSNKSSPKRSLIVNPNKLSIKPSNLDIGKDVYSYDSGSNASSSKSRGPFVHIRGPRDSPLSVNVINTALTDEDGDKKSFKNRKFHDDSEYRHRVRTKGLHCSTLSNKYDAERKDTSWICAFCKRGPHASEFTGPSSSSEVPSPGDLFGPYFITIKCPEFEKRLDDPYDRQFKSRKITKSLDAANALKTNNKKIKKKLETNMDPMDLYLGITDTGNNSYEVWIHEDCMVWSSGVYLIGPKIAGLEEAVWNCSNMLCVGCGLRGANVTCVKRGCLNASHVSCARKSHWKMDEEEFKAYCPEHVRLQ